MKDFYDQVVEAVEEVLSDYIIVVRCKRCIFYDDKTSECKQICRTGETVVVNEDYYCADGIRK